MKNNLFSSTLKKIRTVGLAVLVLLSVQSNAQTTLISPSGDGGFETGTTFASNGWQTANATGNNGWFCGTQAFSAGSRGAYVSTNGGVTNISAPGILHRSHLY